MNVRWTLIFALVAAISLAAVGCDEALDPDSVDPPSELCGQAILQNQQNHYGVQINLRLENSDDLTIITDEDGTFTIPFELHPGAWTLEATYPFFGSESTSFEVKNGLPETDLEELVLPQQVTFQVSTDMSVYRIGETVHITLLVNNVTDQDIILASETSPLLAIAIVKDGDIALGSLYPGDSASPEEVVIPAGDVADFYGDWTTDVVPVDAGFYSCYAVLAASSTYPSYFGPNAGELNRTLLEKLVPAEIELR